jgi:lipoprotein
MKKNLIILLVLVISLTLTGCGNNENKEQAVVIDQLDIEEGCYKTETNSNNLICITKDLSYYDVLYKDGKYYRDDYYHTSPPTEEQTESYKFKTDGGLFDIYHYSNGKEYLALMCLGKTNNTFDCSEIMSGDLSPSGKAESVKVLYTKVDEKFDKETIENLPLYERNKEFIINYNGEEISCNLTRNYSITNSSSGLVISNCLSKKFNDTYKVVQLDSSDNWQIYTDDIRQTYANNISYIIANYSYNVTVNNESFGYLKSFPIDPYSTDEKMIVTITKK